MHLPAQDRLEHFERLFKDEAGLHCEQLVGAVRTAAARAVGFAAQGWPGARAPAPRGRGRWHRARLYHLMRQVPSSSGLSTNMCASRCCQGGCRLQDLSTTRESSWPCRAPNTHCRTAGLGMCLFCTLTCKSQPSALGPPASLELADDHAFCWLVDAKQMASKQAVNISTTR